MPNWSECRIPERHIPDRSNELKAEILKAKLEGMLIPECRNLECRNWTEDLVGLNAEFFNAGICGGDVGGGGEEYSEIG
jgi:hypothetical protein